jgi:ParB/RepB/Spo0J family partition protein
MSTLAAYVPKPKPTDDEQITHLALDLIDPDPENPRGDDESENIRELADAIASVGFQGAIKVRPTLDGRYQIVYGERRFRACSLLGRTSIPAQIEAMDDERAEILQAMENAQREEPHRVLLACKYQKILQRLKKQQCPNPIASLAKLIRKSEAHVSDVLYCGRCSAETQEAIALGLTKDMKKIRVLEGMKPKKRQAILAEAKLAGSLTDAILHPPRVKRERTAQETTEATSVEVATTPVPITTTSDVAQRPTPRSTFVLHDRRAVIALIRASGLSHRLPVEWDSGDDGGIAEALTSIEALVLGGA